MAIPTFTSTGSKATTAIKLDKTVFEVEVKSHQLLKDAYVAYLANGRENLAVTKTRGLVSGGGKKPWKQKGTGRARFGSSRVPIWRGGGITFGPTGLAIRQALSLSYEAGKVAVIESFDAKGGKVRPTVELLKKVGASRETLLVVDTKDHEAVLSTRNISGLKLVQARYLNVYDVMNAHHVIFTKDALEIVSDWLGGASKKEGDK